MATSPFTWGAQGKKMSPEEVARQRAVAALLSQEAIDTSPVGHWSQGAARLVNAFSGVRKERQASAAEEQGRLGAKSVIDALLGGGNVSMSSMGASPSAPAGVAPVAEGGLGYSGQAPSAPMAQGGNKQAFIEAMMPHALAVSAQTGLDPRLVIAQSAQETGWGKSAPGNNYFGIKSHGKGGGNTLATNEVINGQTVRINDSFRGYGDMGESALGYASFLKENPRYRDMLSAPDLDSQVAALGRSGYATDPNYAASVGSIARSIPMPDGSVSMSTQGAPSAGGYAPQMQGTSPVMQALLQASTDPWVAKEYGPVLQALMGQEQSRQQFAMEQADPMRQLEMQKAQLEIEQMRNPDAPKPIEVGGVLLDPVTYQPIFDSRQQEAPTRLITGQEAIDMGLPPGAYNMGADGKVTAIGGGGTTINNNMPGQDKFDEAFAAGDAKTLSTISDTGMAAQRNIGRIDELDSLLANNPTGFAAAGKQKLGEWGIATEGLDDLQAAQALVNSLVPEQRQPGSGPMSDADLALFKQSLPRLINQPGGNAQIIGTMRAIAEYDAAGAEIVQRVRAGEMTRSEGFAALQGRVNPLERLKEEAPARGGILPAPPESAAVENVGPPVKRMRYDPVTKTFQ